MIQHTGDLLPYFKGTWQLEREIFTPGTEELYAVASGTARFEQEDEGQLYFFEEGKLTIQATQAIMNFHKSFAYHFNDGLLAVYFNDGPDKGKLYQEYQYYIAEQQLQSACVHHCIRDMYDATYQILAEHSFLHTSIIKGPAKDMLIRSRFSRL